MKTLLQHDADWSAALRVAEKPGPLRQAAAFLAHSGDSWFWAAGMMLLWGFWPTFWKQWAVYQLFWIAALAALVIALKFLIRRRRPEGEWGAIYRNTDPHSFPSGHAARAFLIAGLGVALGPGWLAALLCLWAPLVALARVAMGVHYLSDILAGALLGGLVAWAALPLSPGIFAAISGWIEPILGFPLWW